MKKYIFMFLAGWLVYLAVVVFVYRLLNLQPSIVESRQPTVIYPPTSTATHTPVPTTMPTPTPQPTQVVILPADAQLRRHTSGVWAGPPDATELPLLHDEAWLPFAPGSKITTDHTGEGWLSFTQACIENRMYVFFQSELVYSECSKDHHMSTNSFCVKNGATAIFNTGCAAPVKIETLSAEITLENVWAVVAYLPNQKMTLVLALHGDQIQAAPVIDEASQTLGEAQSVDQDYFWFSSSNDQVQVVANLATRTRHPLEQLPLLIEEIRHYDQYDQADWQELIADIKARAMSDGVSVQDFPCIVVAEKGLRVWAGAGSEHGLLGGARKNALLLPLAKTITDASEEWWHVLVKYTTAQEMAVGVDGWVIAGPHSLSCLEYEMDARLAIVTSTPTPIPTSTPTPSPTATSTVTPIPTVTLTATPTPSPTPYWLLPPDQEIIFTNPPTCVTLGWAVSHVQAVYFEGEQVGLLDSRELCPWDTTLYTWQIVLWDGEVHVERRTIRVKCPSCAS